MPIKTLWNDNTQTTIRMTVPQTVQECDWYTAVSQFCVMLNTVTHPVNLIIDMSDLKALPFDIIASINASRPRFHANHGAQIIVVKKSLGRPLSALLRDSNMMTGSGVATSIEEAQATLTNMMQLEKIS